MSTNPWADHLKEQEMIAENWLKSMSVPADQPTGRRIWWRASNQRMRYESAMFCSNLHYHARDIIADVSPVGENETRISTDLGDGRGVRNFIGGFLDGRLVHFREMIVTVLDQIAVTVEADTMENKIEKLRETVRDNPAGYGRWVFCVGWGEAVGMTNEDARELGHAVVKCLDGEL